MRLLIPGLFAFTLFIFSACQDKVENIDSYDYQTERLKEFLPLQTGRYITYRVDSTVFTNAGRDVEIHTYRIKHIVEAPITDNLGRPGYRIIKLIADTTATAPWAAAGTYFITPLQDRVEVVEDNLRTIKLKTPLRLNFSWKGNSFLPFNPYNFSYGTLNFKDTKNWDYAYTNFSDELINNTKVKDVWTIEQLNDISTVVGGLSSVGFSQEKYAKDIGLVFKELTLWDEQPNNGSKYKTGFSVKMWMVDHN